MELPARDRELHATKLRQDIAEAIHAAENQWAERDSAIAQDAKGLYLEFEIPAAQAAVVDKLENNQGHSPIELVNVRLPLEDSDAPVLATVFVPEARRDYYKGKVEQYESEDRVNYEKGPDRRALIDARGNRIEKSRRPKNETLVASVDTIRLAGIWSLYSDDPGLFPVTGQEVWWEVWLRSGTYNTLINPAKRLNIEIREHAVRFAEREVVLARATPEALTRLITHTDAIAELRLNRDTSALFMEMQPTEQIEWADDLLNRLTPPLGTAPAVCILDSGTTRLHPLIEPALHSNDHQAWTPNWSPIDDGQWRGHGTQMSGLALYGDLTPVLVGSENIVLYHRLESVKILPDRGQNDRDLYGHVTAAAVSRAEIQAPRRNRVFCMAVTEEGDHWRGRPSSWSAKVDDLAYGEGADQRLTVISAGNIPTGHLANEYPDRNDASGVESPAQAWNALTVGATTERCTITDPSYAGWRALAPAGDLSPCSRTSLTFGDDWPIKPDVVFEGGNQGVDPATGMGDHVDDLALLSTFHQPNLRLFTVTGDTSAAAAMVARMGAELLADNPSMWPETVRGLVVHSARWTQAMRGRLPDHPNQSHKRILLRRYGYGVPDLNRARRSASNDVTLVVEGEMQPFQRNGKSRDMILHEFPWPHADLEALGDGEVCMRVTLSYFIEPNPGERGWMQRHRYASHGLRFAVKRSEENMNDFRQRINKAARDEEGSRIRGGMEAGWYFGPRLRNRGSLHSDIWEGPATDLASRHAIAVYPTVGWWRQKPSLQRADRRTRYTLIVSLQAPVGVDLYTPLLTAISSQVDIEVDG